jgi:multimeric flavodoxin WrbA
MSNIAVIYYSSTGHVHKLAEAVEQGARDAGADVRLRRVAELASEDVIRSNDAWHEHYTERWESCPKQRSTICNGRMGSRSAPPRASACRRS